MSTARTAPKPVDSSTREVRRLASLLDTSQALTGTLDLKAGLHRVLEILGRHHGAVRSTVVMLDEDTGQLQVEASDGLDRPGYRVSYQLGEGITGRVVESSKPIVVPQISREPMFLNRASKRSRAAAAGAQLHLRADHAEPQGRGRARRRPQVQARSRLRPHARNFSASSPR